MNRELDVRIAETFFGWVWIQFEPAHTVGIVRSLFPPSSLTAKMGTRATGEEPLAVGWDCDLPYCTDICLAVEEKIKEMGLMREYGLSLARELGLFDNERDIADFEGKDLFALAHASPEVRCIAALECLESNRAGKNA